MDANNIVQALLGGVLIGVAVTFMLLFNGRVTGISGILSESLSGGFRKNEWRWLFLAGLIAGGLVMFLWQPSSFTNSTNIGMGGILLAGFLVGFGTVMGSGCTSGHGVCGVSRLSKRSLAATATFMLFGFLSVQAVLFILGDSFE